MINPPKVDYYSLFMKYRTDYQIDAILNDSEPEDKGEDHCYFP